MQSLAGIAAVFLLLGAALWWLRRKALASGGANASGRQVAERIGRLRLGPQHSLELVRLADRVLVVAVHASGCTLLDTLPWAGTAPEAGGKTLESRP